MKYLIIIGVILILVSTLFIIIKNTKSKFLFLDIKLKEGENNISLFLQKKKDIMDKIVKIVIQNEKYKDSFDEFNGDVNNQSDNFKLHSVLNNYYNKKLFSTNITGNSREEIIKNICKNIKKYINIPDNFYDLVMKRESLSETDFGNLVAIPHPFEIVTDETFVFVAILEKPIIWYKNNVQVVFLVSISNKKDDNLQKFYQYTVDFLLNEKNVIKLIENRSFENLMYLLKNSSGE